MAKSYIVWNWNQSEGFVTKDPDDAHYVRTGERLSWGVSAAGQAFRETYCGDDEGDPDYMGELPMQEVELP